MAFFTFLHMRKSSEPSSSTYFVERVQRRLKAGNPIETVRRLFQGLIAAYTSEAALVKQAPLDCLTGFERVQRLQYNPARIQNPLERMA